LTTEEQQQLGQALSFTSPVELGRIFNLLGWTFDDEIRELVHVARQNVSMAAKISAIKALRSILVANLKLSGLIEEVSEHGADKKGDYSLSASRTYQIIRGEYDEQQ